MMRNNNIEGISITSIFFTCACVCVSVEGKKKQINFNKIFHIHLEPNINVECNGRECVNIYLFYNSCTCTASYTILHFGVTPITNQYKFVHLLTRHQEAQKYVKTRMLWFYYKNISSLLHFWHRTLLTRLIFHENGSRLRVPITLTSIY